MCTVDWGLAANIAQVVTALVAVIVLILTPSSWKKASNDAQNQVKLSAILSTNFIIYKEILQNVNEILSKNSIFIMDLKTHTNNVADILNRWHGEGGYVKASAEEKIKLIDKWVEPSNKLVTNVYELQRKALELTRLLDMSGADFGKNSKIYNALWIMYHDLNNSMTKLTEKWTKLILEQTTVQQYQWLLEETNSAVDLSNEFSSCVEDVLKHVYNKLVAVPMGKSLKKIDNKDKRRMIVEDGLRDNRIENAS